MRKENRIKFVISRIFNFVIFLGGLIFIYQINIYPIYGIGIMILSIINFIWGILGAFGYFHEKIMGNIISLLFCLLIGIASTICLISSIIWGPVIFVTIASLMVISGTLFTFFCDITIFAAYGD